jgi:hypothetical protein
MVYVRLAQQWTDQQGTEHAPDTMVDVDAATLAELEAVGVVAEASLSLGGAGEDPDGGWPRPDDGGETEGGWPRPDGGWPRPDDGGETEGGWPRPDGGGEV